MSNAIGDYEGVHFQGNGGGACFRYSALTELGLSLTQLLYAEEDSGFARKIGAYFAHPVAGIKT